MKVFSCFLSVLLMTLAACTSDPTSHNQNSTYSPTAAQKVNTAEKAKVADGFRYVATAGPFHAKQEVTLTKGDYVAEFQDNDGTYYRGPAKCVYTDGPGAIGKKYLDGGLWVPKNHNQTIAVYYVIGSEGAAPGVVALPGSSAAGTAGAGLGAGVVNAINAGTRGKISFALRPDTDAELLRLVKISK